jgi:hypothetical protein
MGSTVTFNVASNTADCHLQPACSSSAALAADTNALPAHVLHVADAGTR